MGLFSFLKHQPGAVPATAGADAAQVIAAARMRARRRLIGAVVLLGIGVIAFPLLFETQPRPIPVDITIEIPRKEGAPPLALPATAAASKPAPVITESRAEAGKEAATPAAPAAKVEAKPAPKADNAPQSQPAAAAASRPEKAEKAAPEAAGRFVVQVGAFADAAVARDARVKVEKLGLHTYTQAVDTDNGKRTRVRVGPFASRDEAEQAAARLKAAGLPAAVLTL